MKMRSLFVIVVLTTLFSVSCKGSDSVGSSTGGKLIFEDSFDRKDIGESWLDTSKGRFSIVDGRLRVQGAHNKPLWLNKKLPRNSRVEFTARSVSPAVDIKVEMYGDGKSYARQASYTATSYVLVLGGWNNSRSIIARMDEHAKDRKERKRPRGEKDRAYRFSITRQGNLLTWTIDGERFLKWDDAKPLEGAGHEHFAFNNWETEVYFDDLAVYKL